MLAIRMQRTGRTGHAQFRVIVQDSRAHPKRGKVVAYLGNYDPHTKQAALNSEEINAYLKNGAQPSERIVKLFKKEGIKVPKWAVSETKKKQAVKNPEKLRRNRPAQEQASEDSAAQAAGEPAAQQESPAEATDTETAAETPKEASELEKKAEEPSEPEAATEPETPKEA